MADLAEIGRVLTRNRKANGQFSPEAKAAIASFAAAGESHVAIAKAFGAKRTQTIGDICSRIQHQKTVQIAPRKGRPRRLSPR